MKNTLITVLLLALIGFGAYLFFSDTDKSDRDDTTSGITNNDDTSKNNIASSTIATTTPRAGETIIGTSVDGRDITAYHFGKGNDEILLIGGIHGGYSWNTALVAFEAIDYFKKNESLIPDNITLTIIPILNPDGLYSVVEKEGRFTANDVSTDTSIRIAGRFNAHGVDLNRNFDCTWQATSMWQSRSVSGGTSAFSEPEARAIKDYVEAHLPSAALVWYSAAGGVYASSCDTTSILPETRTLINIFATASGYKAYEDFDSYNITGDMVNWLAKKKIPAISVLLTTHDSTEWNKNKAGIEALIQEYAK